MAVPICNAIALLFSFLTSSLLGEPIEKPFQTILGASLILIGVTICVSSQEWIIQYNTIQYHTNQQDEKSENEKWM